MDRPELTSFLEILKSRRSIRAFTRDDIPDEAIAQILTAGTLAPSAGNLQPWFLYLVREETLKARLVQAALGQQFIADAPVVIVVCIDLERARAGYKARGESLYCLQDSAAAIQNMLLCVHAMGLGACWVGAFDEVEVRAALTLPARHRPVAIIPIGKPAAHPRPPGRRPLDEVYTEVD
jgi:nitroreductase